MNAQDVMARNVNAIGLEARVFEAAKPLNEKNIPALAVVDQQGDVVGGRERIPKKLIGFFDQNALQYLDSARFPFDRTIPFERTSALSEAELMRGKES